MVKIDIFLKKGMIVKINELELNRYADFFENSYKDNLEHCKSVLSTYPRWSIISGYYSMHDITKLLLAKKFMIKVEYKVHTTTIRVLAELIVNFGFNTPVFRLKFTIPKTASLNTPTFRSGNSAVFVIKNKELLSMIKGGYSEFITLANDLANAKRDRVKTQYYTGTDFMKGEYRKKSSEFLSRVVEPYLSKIIILGELKK